MSDTALLALEDGSVFIGESLGAKGYSVGEVVFNTAMTGYQEILTDPSYAKQLVTLTYPHIGNTGVNSEDIESNAIHAAGLIVRDVPLTHSCWRQEGDLRGYLRDAGIVAIADIDTRKLTRILREKGAQSGCLMAGSDTDIDKALALARGFPGLKGMDLAQTVTTREPYQWHNTVWRLNDSPISARPGKQYRVAVYDFGIKHNILRLLVDRGCDVTVYPAKTPAQTILASKPDGVFLSNGPGDPEPCGYAIEAIKEIIETNIPVFGICLGHQLLGLASGAKTEKMKFGHHGANHPVQDLTNDKVMITSQNHGFAVSEASLPANLEVTHRSLFDGSVQGIKRKDKPAFSFQGHPEASPGPHDVQPLFDQFIELMKGRV
ncbi:MAG: glutamine-hydrolyzing carbamoyl-phosphate synthase small subunit [Gammaproteobacteria bacterium]|nr:glutamine-hydrolyzing carbamoyl-phosphate synthase small subunit [Gammaproteobacteria bacterium]